ncbi:hypothetical protein SAY87_024203 [Trapa incisa]|uniref:Protein PLASTID MOVEMENT IMPAIRED 2 n=1 Tax=Trapa incisa TaxID=236973 RepID=A0AAN7L865_9MYRT|nr:hypothetical protein SAY87_024203 [Trapa incisa]
MVGIEFENRSAGPVKATVNMYREKLNRGDSRALRTRQIYSSEESPSSRAKELLLARKDEDRHEESGRAADKVKTRAETELLEEQKTVTNLKALIEESHSKAKSRAHGSEKLWKHTGCEAARSMSARNSQRYHHHDHRQVMNETEIFEQKLSRLKLDVASVLEEKSQAEKEAEASSSKLASYSAKVEALRKEIEDVNDEQMLVELARIEALKELGGIETQREKEASIHMAAMEESRRKIKEINEEIDRSKDIEARLAITLSDIEVLQVGLSLATNDKQKRGNDFSAAEEGRESAVASMSSLRSVKEELEQAKKELASISKEGFQFMAWLDVIRNELNHVTEEAARLKEEKVDSTVQGLNSKILRAKSKIEAISAAEKKANLIASNLSATLERLKAESETREREKKEIEEETSNIRAEIESTEREIDVTEEKLQAAMMELEEARASEASALEKLGILMERTARDRAAAAAAASRQYGRTSASAGNITISKFEYDYLRGKAGGAQEIADKKVAAAQAWIEALKAGEREISMRKGLARRRVQEMRVHEEQKVYKMERSLSSKNKAEEELMNWGPLMVTDRNKLETWSEHPTTVLAADRPPRSPTHLMKKLSSTISINREKSFSSPARGFRVRKSGSPAAATRLIGRSPSITVKRRKKVMPSISKLFTGRSSKL